MGTPVKFYTDEHDFLRLHADGVPHAGIAYAPHEMSVGDSIRGLMLIHQVLDAEDMLDRVEYL